MEFCIIMYTTLQEYLDSVFPDKTVQTTVLHALGYAANNRGERNFIIFEGTGGNGKSQFMKLIENAYPAIHVQNNQLGSQEMANATFAIYHNDTNNNVFSDRFVEELYFGTHRMPYSRETVQFGGTLIMDTNSHVECETFPAERVVTIPFTQRFTGNTRFTNFTNKFDEWVDEFRMKCISV